MPSSDAQKAAAKRYYEKNKDKLSNKANQWGETNQDKKRHSSLKSSAKTFVNKYASIDELNELTKLIEERKKEETN